MFKREEIDMAYKEFISNILDTRGRFLKKENSYFERHHILPKCLGGGNERDNLIDLYPREHFIAHKLLAEENPNDTKLARAFILMTCCSTDDQERYIVTEQEYEEARIAYSNALKELYKDKRNHPSYGKHISEERKKLIGDINRGNKYCVGRIVSEETRRKIGEANKNPKKETRERMRKARKGKWLLGENPNAKKL